MVAGETASKTRMYDTGKMQMIRQESESKGIVSANFWQAGSMQCRIEHKALQCFHFFHFDFVWFHVDTIMCPWSLFDMAVEFVLKGIVLSLKKVNTCY